MRIRMYINMMLLCIMTYPAWAEPPVKTGKEAPNFSGRTAEGREINLADYRGKVVLLDFWASWCPPCRQEMPFLIELHQTYRDAEVEIISVNIDDKTKNMDKFLSRLKGDVPFSIILDREKLIPALYEIKAMPTTILIDRQGIVRSRHNGFEAGHKQRYIEELNHLLSEKKEP